MVFASIQKQASTVVFIASTRSDQNLSCEHQAFSKKQLVSSEHFVNFSLAANFFIFFLFLVVFSH